MPVAVAVEHTLYQAMGKQILVAAVAVRTSAGPVDPEDQV
jgi:hypothetical protein